MTPKSLTSCFVRSVGKITSKQLLKSLFSEWSWDRSGSRIIDSTFKSSSYQLSSIASVSAGNVLLRQAAKSQKKTHCDQSSDPYMLFLLHNASVTLPTKPDYHPSLTYALQSYKVNNIILKKTRICRYFPRERKGDKAGKKEHIGLENDVHRQLTQDGSLTNRSITHGCALSLDPLNGWGKTSQKKPL